MLTLVDLRKRAKRTQEDVARSCNVTQGAVSHWEAGRGAPLRKYYRYLKAAFDCTDEELSEAIRETLGG